MYLCVRKTFLLVQLSGCKILNFAQELCTGFFIVAYKLGHTKLIFCFWSYKSQMTRPPAFFFSWKLKRKENGVQTAKCIVEGEVWGTRPDNIVYLRSQNIEAWMVKPLSACRLCREIDLHADQKQEISFVWPWCGQKQCNLHRVVKR